MTTVRIKSTVPDINIINSVSKVAAGVHEELIPGSLCIPTPVAVLVAHIK